MTAPWNLHLAEIKLGSFDGLIGIDEGQHFEAKGSSGYDLDNKADIYEFAKDVTAFANTDGGLIALGVVTARLVNTDIDRVTHFQLIERGGFDSRKFESAIARSIFPKISGLSIDWHASTAEANQGIIVVTIPPQSADEKPFIVLGHIVPEEVGELKGFFAGFVRRVGAANEPMTARDLQRLVRRGMQTQSVQFARIEEKLDAVLSRQSSVTGVVIADHQLAKTFEERIAMIVDLDRPYLVIGIKPKHVNQVRRMFASGHGTASNYLESPGYLRGSGFDLNTGAIAELRNAEFLEVRQGERKVVRLYEDGTLIARVAADDMFLQHGTKRGVINSLALAEVCVSFARLFEKIRGTLLAEPSSAFDVTVWFSRTDAHGPIALIPHAINKLSWLGWEDQATLEKGVNCVKFVVAEKDVTPPDHLAYLISAAVHRCFGVLEGKIPYTYEVQGRTDLDAKEIAMGRS